MPVGAVGAVVVGSFVGGAVGGFIEGFVVSEADDPVWGAVGFGAWVVGMTTG